MQQTCCIIPIMHQSCIPQYTIFNRNKHISAHFCYKMVFCVCRFLLQNGVLWDICLMHCGICEMGLWQSHSWTMRNHTNAVAFMGVANLYSNTTIWEASLLAVDMSKSLTDMWTFRHKMCYKTYTFHYCSEIYAMALFLPLLLKCIHNSFFSLDL